MKRIVALGIIAIFFLGTAQAATAPKLFQTCSVDNGGDHFAAGDIQKLAKFDLCIFNAFCYGDLGGNAWGQIKAINPNTLIYTYLLGMQTAIDQDGYAILQLNTIDSYTDLNNNHPDLFLLDASGNRIMDPDYTDCVLMDFGSPTYQQYWLTKALNDKVNQAWKADGIFVDRCDSIFNNQFATPAKYPTDAQWCPAMISFVAALQAGMNPYQQKIYPNLGNTRVADGAAVWKALDACATPPDAMHEEGAFVVRWGAPSPGAWFYQESEWLMQVQLMGQIHHSKTVWESHCNMTQTQTGTDQSGRSVGFWDAFWYAMCSYLMGKNSVDNNSYFAWAAGVPTTWYDEWTNLDLGAPLGAYTVTKIGSVNVYSRQYQKGTVFVNPGTASATITITGSQLSHANYTTGVPVTSITLAPDRGTIVMTAGTPPSPPTNLRIVP